MTEPAIVRAAYLHVYLDVLREIGVPVERELERSALPTWIEEMPDAYVSLPLAIDWVMRCGRDIEPMEFGFLAARRETLDTTGLSFREALLDAPTGIARMHRFLRAARSEDSSLITRAWREQDCTRVVCDTSLFDDTPGVCLAEWVNLQTMVETMRSVVGPSWYPMEMTFASSFPPPDAVCEAYGSTRILVGRPHTSILAAADLARPCSERVAALADPAATERGWNFVETLRAVIRPYLGDGYPSLAQTAEVVGMRRRTLQRRLQASGRTYSGLVAEARIERANELLSDPDIRIIDIALALGYDNPQHFSRNFHRVTGMTPTLYRRSVTAEL